MKKAFGDTWQRELRLLARRPRHVVLLTLGLVFSYLFFLTLMTEGQPAKLPIAIVDQDGSYLSRRLCHEIETMQGVHIVAVYQNHGQARAAMQRQEIFAFYEIPKNIYSDVLAFKAPNISLYSSNAYLMPGSFSYKNLATIGKMASAAVQREVLRKKGYSEKQIMGIIQPIELDTHTISNAETSYMPYVLTTVLPGILGVMVLLFTIYKVSDERKRNTVVDWMGTAKGNVMVAVTAKLLPYTIWFSLLGVLGNIILFRYVHFTLLGSLVMMSLMVVLLVLAQQSMGVFLAAIIPEQHLAISVGAIYGMLSFTMSGFSYPVTNMPPFLQALSNLFPLRHYYLSYVDIALYGNGIAYYWLSLFALLAFLMGGMLGILLLSRETRQIRTQLACENLLKINNVQ